VTKLVFVVPGRLDQLTGGYLYDRHIIEGLRARRRTVEVIELTPDGNIHAFAALPDGATTIVDGLALPSLKQVIVKQRSRLRLVAVIHHPLSEETGLSPAAAKRVAGLEAAMLPLFHAVLCPSKQTAAAVERYSVPPDRIAVIPPGTAKPTLFRRRRGRIRALLSVASLIPRKGHRVLIEALVRIRDLDWNLICVGSLERDPGTAREIRNIISAAHLERRVKLVGEQPPIVVCRAYQAADAFVLPSFHEGYGMAYAEAMAHGLPIIATTAGAIPETVPRTAGMLVAPGDPVALALALRRMIVQPALTARLSAGARAAGARLPSWRQATEQWEQALDRLAAQQPSS
jgi:glycosyltransferase involved in cell wall biosynthesis